MPKSLARIEAEIRALAARTVESLVEAGPEADFVPLVSAPLPAPCRDADPRRARGGRAANAVPDPADVRRAGRRPQQVRGGRPPARPTAPDRGRRGQGFRGLFRRPRGAAPRASHRGRRRRSSPTAGSTASRSTRAILPAITSSSPPPGTTPLRPAPPGRCRRWRGSRAVRAGQGRPQPGPGYRRGSDPLDHPGPALHAHRRRRTPRSPA